MFKKKLIDRVRQTHRSARSARPGGAGADGCRRAQLRQCLPRPNAGQPQQGVQTQAFAFGGADAGLDVMEARVRLRA
jgi:hypothetical protein